VKLSWILCLAFGNSAFRNLHNSTQNLTLCKALRICM